MRTIRGFFRILYGLFGLLLTVIAALVLLSQTHPGPMYAPMILLLLVATALTACVSMLLVTRRVVRPMTELTNNLEALVAKRTEALEGANAALTAGETRLRSSEQRYRTLFESAGEAIFILEGDRFVDCNRRTLELLGIGKEELLGRSVIEFSPQTQPDGRDSAEKARDKLKATLGEGTQKFEWLHTRRNGELFPVAVTLTPVQMDDHTRVLAVVRDITERKRAEAELQAAHQQLADIIEFLPDATFVVDKDKRVIAWNRALEEMTGVPKADMIGKNDYAYSIPFWSERRPIAIDLIGGPNPDVEAHYDYVNRRGNTLVSEAFVPSLNKGSGAHVWITASALLDPNGIRYGAIETIRDITDRKQAEQELHDRVAELERFNRLTAEREVRLMEVKRAANDVAAAAGLPPPYSLSAAAEIPGSVVVTPTPLTSNPPSLAYTLDQLVDIQQLSTLMEQFHRATGFANAVIDNDGKVFTASGWQRACTHFHRVNRETCAMCIKSDQYILEHLHDGPYIGYRCANGLTDYAVPIIIEGQHLANLFTGQMFHEPPDLAFFRAQAARFGFDGTDYIKAICEVPIVPKARMDAVMPFLTTLANMLAHTGLIRRKELETARKRSEELHLEREAALNLVDDANEARHAAETARQSLHASEAKLRLLLDSTSEAIYGTDADGNCTFCNPACVSLLGFKGPEDLLGRDMHLLIHDTHPDQTPFPVEECRIYRAFREGKGCHLDDEWFRRVDGTYFAAECRAQPQIEDGRIIGSVVSLSDITARHQAEADHLRQLDELRRWYSTTINREERILELKNEVNQTLEKMGTPKKYYVGAIGTSRGATGGGP